MEGWFAQSTSHCLICGGLRKYTVRAGANPQNDLLHDARQSVERLLCGKCADAIPWVIEIKCEICGRYEDCPDCVRRKEGERIINRSAVQYDSLMKDWLALYKYRGSEKLEPLFAAMTVYAFSLLLRELKRLGTDRDAQAIISYIPLSERRLGERGFNQAERMAVRLSQEHRLPLLPLLERTRHTEKQSYKSRKERLESLEGAFSVTREGLKQLKDIAKLRPVKIILVDDVYTTGSTLNRCASELIQATDSKVSVYAITWFR